MKKILLAIFVFFASLSLSAQQRTGYFVDSYSLGHLMNPAFAPNQGFVGIPLLSNISVNINSNLGAGNFLYPLDNGKVGLFLHPKVSSDVVLGKLSDMNFLDGTLGLDIINVGWFAGKNSFWTIDAGVKVAARTALPKDFFRLVKNGMDDDTGYFNLDNLGMSLDAYSYVSAGYSYSFDDFVKGLRVGGKLKLLAGMLNFATRYDDLEIDMSSEVWRLSGSATGYILGGGVEFTYDPETGVVNGINPDLGGLGVSGIGGAIDLGIQYKISEGCAVDGLRFSASVVDLGFITYFKNKSTHLVSNGQVAFNGFEDIITESEEVSNQLEDLIDGAVSIVSFRKSEQKGNSTIMLSSKVHAGVDYTFFKNQMNVGLLYVGHFSKIRNQHEMMFSFNYTPAEWFDVAVSYSFMHTRSSVGWLLSFTPKKGLNLFLGSDYTAVRYTPQGIPVDKSFLGVNLGISVPIGAKR